MVADKAKGVFSGKKNVLNILKEKALTLASRNSYDIDAEFEGENLVIVAKGVSAHGAMPEKGLNAISIMMEALIGMEFEDRGLQDFVEFYCEKIGFNYHGEKIAPSPASAETGAAERMPLAPGTGPPGASDRGRPRSAGPQAHDRGRGALGAHGSLDRKSVV